MKNKEHYEPERDEGFIEYKRLLSNIPSQLKLEKLTTQLKYRLEEGNGECIYVLGVADDGEILGLSEKDFQESLSILDTIAKEIEAETIVIRKQTIDDRYFGEILVRQKRLSGSGFPLEVVLAVIGNVDSGKSSLIGSLITGKKDDGDGLTRQYVMRHPHEVLTGRTSSVASKILGFKTDGTIVNYHPSGLGKVSEEDIIKNSSKLIRMIDLAGHEKYLKTTIFGMLGTEPDYAAIFVDSNRGVQKMTKEHLGLASVLKIPFFCVLTKIDMAPPLVYRRTLEDLKKVLKSPVLSFIPKLVKDADDIAVLAPILNNGKVVPIIPVSTVSGENMDLLRKFLNLLAPRKLWEQVKNSAINKIPSDPFLLFIEDWFHVTGVGPIMAGIVQSGEIRVGTICSLGPDTNGNYIKVKVRSIQSRRIPLEVAFPGQYVSIALAFNRGFPRRYRKGMILTTFQTPKAYRRFKAEIKILHHPTTIHPNYCAQLHIKTIRAQARITKIEKDGPLRTGDSASVELEFLYSPYFLFEGLEFVFREGRTKGYGIITNLLT